jgi:diguanylate cyclase (GGDEF)-like protein/PAS domain S-box-containing protein
VASPNTPIAPMRSRQPLAILLGITLLLPALLVAILLWSNFVSQLEQTNQKRLFSSLNVLELVVAEAANEFRASLARLAVDNTLQVTVMLDIRPQMLRYLRTQFDLSEFTFLSVHDLEGEQLMAAGTSASEAHQCSYPSFDMAEQVVAQGGKLFLQRSVALVQDGQALGFLCAGLHLNGSALGKLIEEKVDGNAWLLWSGASYSLNGNDEGLILDRSIPADQNFEFEFQGGSFLGRIHAIPLGDQTIDGLVMVSQDAYDKASIRSLAQVGAVLLAVLLLTGLGLRMLGLRRQAESELIKEREKAVTTLTSIADGVVTTDEFGFVNYVNPAAERLIGETSGSLLGRHLDDAVRLVHEGSGEKLVDLETLVGNQSEVRFQEAVLLGNNARETAVHCSVASIDPNSRHSGAVITFRDIHRERELRRRLAWKASRDDLTGLLNRSEFRRKLQKTIAETRDSESHHCLLYIDLDEFKVVNDTCGHGAGDDLLRQVSARLVSLLRRMDIVARLGGDEFGVLLLHCSRERGLDLAGEMIEIINDMHFHHQDRLFHVGASIGMVSINSDTVDIEDLLATVDAACYAAKDRGRNQVFLGKIDSKRILHRMEDLSRASSIRQALKENRLVLYRQAIVSTDRPSRDQEVHAEVLVRMIDTEGKLVPPGAFIPTAERHGLMQQIDRWVITNLFESDKARLRNWRPPTGEADASRDFIYSINLSGSSLTDSTFLDFVRDALQEFQIPGGAVAFEITETQVITHLDRAVEFISALKPLGCRFLLDDFGSGMSSFGYLKRLPVDYLKIDGLFVRDILTDPIDRAMVKMINEIGHTMGLVTIAEYVENAEILEQVRSMGVDMAQGYGIETPSPLIRRQPLMSVVGS